MDHKTLSGSFCPSGRKELCLQRLEKKQCIDPELFSPMRLQHGAPHATNGQHARPALEQLWGKLQLWTCGHVPELQGGKLCGVSSTFLCQKVGQNLARLSKHSTTATKRQGLCEGFEKGRRGNAALLCLQHAPKEARK